MPPLPSLMHPLGPRQAPMRTPTRSAVMPGPSPDRRTGPHPPRPAAEPTGPATIDRSPSQARRSRTAQSKPDRRRLITAVQQVRTSAGDGDAGMPGSCRPATRGMACANGVAGKPPEIGPPKQRPHLDPRPFAAPTVQRRHSATVNAFTSAPVSPPTGCRRLPAPGPGHRLALVVRRLGPIPTPTTPPPAAFWTGSCATPPPWSPGQARQGRSIPSGHVDRPRRA